MSVPKIPLEPWGLFHAVEHRVPINDLRKPGRDAGLMAPYDRFRLDWRTDKVTVDSNTVSCATFDELHRHMDRYLRLTTGY